MNGREHALRVGDEVIGLDEEVLLRDVRRVHVGVARGAVAVQRVLLHLLAHDPAARVPDRQARPDLVREGEQVELLAEAAVIPLGRFLEPLLVGAQLVFGRPGGAVDALQLRVLLTPPPVRRRDAGQRPSVADHAGVGAVRTTAEVLPDDLAVPVHVVVDRQLAGADLDGCAVGCFRAGCGAPLEPDQLELERLGSQLGARLFVADDPADEPLAFADDALHLLVDGLDGLRGERLLHAEVVVEAVGDRRPDSEVRLRIDPLHGLGEDVRGGVAQDREPVCAVDGDRLDGIRLGDDRREVLQLAADAQGDDRPIGEQGESVGGMDNVRRRGDVSQGTLQRVARMKGCSASGAHGAPPAQAPSVRVQTTATTVAFGSRRNPMDPV